MSNSINPVGAADAPAAGSAASPARRPERTQTIGGSAAQGADRVEVRSNQCDGDALRAAAQAAGFRTSTGESVGAAVSNVAEGQAADHALPQHYDLKA